MHILSVSKELKQLNAFSFVPPQNSVQNAEKGCYANSSGTCVSTPKQLSTSIKWWIIKRYGSLPWSSLLLAPFNLTETAQIESPNS